MEILVDKDVIFSISNYESVKCDILDVLNRNRPEQHSQEYLDWRYLGEKSHRSPIIFWVQLSNGRRIGMAALIFRSYCVNGQLYDFAVLGDISLDSEYRKLGIATKLLVFMNSYIQEQSIFCAIVIPNHAAQKRLSACAWNIEDSITAYVFAIDASDKFYVLFKNKSVANALSRTVHLLMSKWISIYNEEDCVINYVNKFDESFETFWRAFPLNNLIIRERSVSSLTWRYLDYPHIKFSIVKFIKNNLLVGYMIYFMDKDRNCIICDLIALKNRFVKPFLSLFLKDQFRMQKAKIIRLVVNSRHPYSKLLKALGFVKREEEGVFMSYTNANSVFQRSANWFIGYGDKDA